MGERPGLRRLYPPDLDTSKLSARERMHLGVKDEELPIPDLLSEGYIERTDAVVNLHGFYVKELMSRYPQEVLGWMADSSRSSEFDLVRSALRGEEYILPRDLANRLIRTHQEALNKPLAEKGLYPLFTEHELWAHELHPFFFLEAEHVDMVGDNIGMPMNKVIFGYEDDSKTPKWGAYAYLMMTKEAYSREGALQIVLTDGETKFPEGKSQGKVVISEDKLLEINGGLKERGRAELPLKLVESAGKGSNTIEGYEFNDTNGRFFTILTLAQKDGRRIPLLFNRLDEHGNQGEVNLVRFYNGDFGLVVNPRYLVNSNAIEIPRGWSKQGEKKFTELRQETGLDVEWGELLETQRLMQDPSTDYVSPTISTISFNTLQKMNVDPKYQKLTDEGFEALTPGRLSPRECIQAIKNGLIYDSFSITGISGAMLRSGELSYNSHYKPLHIVLECRHFIQKGNKMGFSIPRGPVGAGEKIGEIPPDTGKSRIVYQIEKGGVEILERANESPAFISIPVEEVVRMLARHDLDVVTHSALAKGFIDRDLLVYRPRN